MAASRLVGIAATCWQTRSISGERAAMYSNRVWIAASRWLRVRMWLPRSCSRWRRKPSDPLEGEILERQPADLAALVGGDEQEQEPDRVAVAAHRAGRRPFDRDQVVDEEGVHDGPSGVGGSSCAPPGQAGSANASNRRLASSSSAGVIVRYTAVETGSTWPRNVER